MTGVVCIVGKSNTGKTALIERLIPEFKRRGYRVATIKHQAQGFEIDQPGKDSWRHAQAGSECVILSSPQKLALVETVDHDLSLAELAQFLRGKFDLVLAEGFSKSHGFKIEVHRKDLGELICDPRELIAVVTDEHLELDTPHPLPQFSPEAIPELADLIERKVIAQAKGEEVNIFADGKPIPLNPYLRGLFYKMIFDMVTSLKGVEEPKAINAWLRRR